MVLAERLRHIPLALFLVGTILAAATRFPLEDLLVSLLTDLPMADLDLFGSCLLCQRSIAWLYLPLRWMLNVISQLFFLGPDAGPFAVATPWGYMDTARTNSIIVALAAYFGSRILLALPVYWLALRLYPGIFGRIVFIIFVLAAMGGWPAVLVNSWFSFMGLIRDWPVAYYNFSALMLHYDWAGIGFLHLLALAILGGMSGPLAAFFLAALGQLMMDNLGLVTGVALGLAAWSAHGFRRGAISIAAAGLGSVLVIAAITLFGDFNMERASFEQAAGETGVLEKIAAWWSFFWEIQGKYNFQWWNVTIANFISLMAWPTVAGLILGVMFAKSRGGTKTDLALRALSFPAIGFFITLLIGLTKSGFGSDMGRQVMPLVIIWVPLAAMVGEAARAAWVRRRNKPRPN